VRGLQQPWRRHALRPLLQVQELLPLILYAIERHPEREARRALIHGLFNLIKKPDEEQRAAIVGACVDLIGRLGAPRSRRKCSPTAGDEVSERGRGGGK